MQSIYLIDQAVLGPIKSAKKFKILIWVGGSIPNGWPQSDIKSHHGNIPSLTLETK
jgi:hypothetical protein